MNSLELQLQFEHENAIPVSFCFGATGPGTMPGPLLGPGGRASVLEDNSDMEWVDGSSGQLAQLERLAHYPKDPGFDSRPRPDAHDAPSFLSVGDLKWSKILSFFYEWMAAGPLSGIILILHTYLRLGARRGGTRTAATGPAPASGPDWQAHLGNASLAGLSASSRLLERAPSVPWRVSANVTTWST
jgi:hypothetical protein